ncbi:hypothetical protein [Kitasatospora sp. A2-31]|uniref:hypothetical protein n=1 Tax=Kitasatospora sp. A2-31 TaxID=2916414 RepID=UPI001EEA200A|nr:hypothetical protein [Kitasatospora sp. A2-31]MCG6496218.1 hypothetical protein [Kitasatospora sp. A2-31]
MNVSTNVPSSGHSEPLAQRLAELRGPAPQRSLNARALAALAANPGCHRRAVLDAAGVDKSALAARLGRPAPFGQSPFAIARGVIFESRLKEDGYAALLEPLRRHLGLPEEGGSRLIVPDLLRRSGPAVRAERTAAALAEAAADPSAWTLLDHPLLRLTVAGSTAYLEPDAVVVHGGRCTVVEIKSFPVLDGSADPAKVGAAARQAAVYVLALQETAAALAGREVDPDPYTEQRLPGSPWPSVLLVCPKDFSNRPTAVPVDVRRELATTRRQLSRMTGIGRLLESLPPGTGFDLAADEDGTPARSTEELTSSVASVPAAYSPDCLSSCELGFHCRAQARCDDRVEQLGRGVRGELGSIRTVTAALAAAGSAGAARPAPGGDTPGGDTPGGDTPGGDTPGGDGADADTWADADEAAARLAYAAALRAEALGRTPAAAVPPAAVPPAAVPPAAVPPAAAAPAAGPVTAAVGAGAAV